MAPIWGVGGVGQRAERNSGGCKEDQVPETMGGRGQNHVCVFPHEALKVLTR